MSTYAAPRWASYIAIGDSVTEGIADPYPGQDVDLHNPGFTDLRFRGWADRLAETMSARRMAAGRSPIEYANLAIRGKKIDAILDEQLPAALAQQPDLISIGGGGNDVLRPGADIDAIWEKLEAAVAKARAQGADVLLITGFRSGGELAFIRGRTGQLNSCIWSIARRQGAYVVDCWGTTSLYDYRLFADDKIHPTSDGHERIMNAALIGLELDPTRPNWDEKLPPRESVIDPDSAVPKAVQPRVAQVKEGARWAKEFAVPWVERRVKGTSSGDGRTAKVPKLEPWLPLEDV